MPPQSGRFTFLEAAESTGGGIAVKEPVGCEQGLCHLLIVHLDRIVMRPVGQPQSDREIQFRSLQEGTPLP